MSFNLSIQALFWYQNAFDTNFKMQFLRPALACAPILSSGDVTGAVAFLAPSNESTANDIQENLIQAASQFLGKQVED